MRENERERERMRERPKALTQIEGKGNGMDGRVSKVEDKDP